MKTKAIVLVSIVIICLAFSCTYFIFRAKWCDEAVASLEIDKISLLYPDAPTEIRNPNDPPLNSKIWYDRSVGLENTITGIDQGIKEIENAVEAGYLGRELLPLIKMPVASLAEKTRSGDAVSQYVMSIRTKIGAGVSKDFKEYKRLLNLSANSNFPLALRETALNVKKEHDEDNEKTDASVFIVDTLFEKYMLGAANLDDPVAMYYLAAFYYFSDSKKGGVMTAGSWFTKCLKKNEILSSLLCHWFAIAKVRHKDKYFVYPEGLSIKDSYNYILSLAKEGVPDAQVILATLSWDRQISEMVLTMPHTDAAMMWHHKAANSGRMKSQEFLGLAYADGSIVPKDLLLASKWLELSASQGEYSASLLGMRYLEGNGVTKELAKAVKWLTIGAVFENDRASQYQIGQLYWNGLGVPKNLLIAYAWINVGSIGGFYGESLSTLKGNLSDSEVLKAEVLSRRIFDLIQKQKRAK